MRDAEQVDVSLTLWDPQEELLDSLEMPAVREEQNHVIIRLHDRVMVSHDDLLAAHNGADEGAFWKRDIANSSANHA